MKNVRVFLSENYHILVVIFSIYLNRHVFVMLKLNSNLICINTCNIIQYYILTLSTQCKIFSRQHIEIFIYLFIIIIIFLFVCLFLFLPKNRFGDNLHELSNSVFWFK